VTNAMEGQICVIPDPRMAYLEKSVCSLYRTTSKEARILSKNMARLKSS